MISAKGEPNDPEAERPNSIIDIESARSKKLRAFLCAGGRFVHICMVCFTYVYRRSFPAKQGGLEVLK